MKSYHESKEQLMLIWTQQQHHHPFPIRPVTVLIRSGYRIENCINLRNSYLNENYAILPTLCKLHLK